MRSTGARLAPLTVILLAAVLGGSCGRARAPEVSATRSPLDTPVWTKTSPDGLPPGRAYSSMAFNYFSGALVLFGGVSNGRDTNDTWVYDLTGWRKLCPAGGCTAPPVRHGAMLANDSAGRMILFGGCKGACSAADYYADTWALTYASGTYTWTQLTPASSPQPLAFAAMAYDATSSQTILFGGTGTSGGYTQATYTWSGGGSTWAQICSGVTCGPVLPNHRARHGLAYDQTGGYLLLYGGDVISGGADTWKFQWTAPSGPYLWIQVLNASPPGDRQAFAMASDMNGASEPVIFGGQDRGTYQVLNDSWRWSATASTWVQFAGGNPRPEPRMGAAMAYLSGTGGGFVALGGSVPSDATGFGDSWFLTTAGNWTQQGMGPRYGHGLVYDPELHAVVAFGGQDGASRSDLVSWDGVRWRHLNVGSQAPSARSFAAVGMQAARKQIVVVNGLDPTGTPSGLAESWYYDHNSSAWYVECSGTACVFPYSFGAAMAYDSVRDCLVMFGGGDGTSMNNRIFERCCSNGSCIWSEACTTSSCTTFAPGARAFAAAAYDQARSRVVFQGGCKGQCNVASDYLADLWEWDGTTWTSGTTGTALRGHSMAYDPRRHKLTVVFGRDASLNLGSTWFEYDGTAWQTRSWSGGSPQLREGAGLAFDEARGAMVLYGGSTGPTTLGDAWDYIAWGSTCAATSDCDDGYSCVTGFCCSTACTGQCAVCAAALGAPADGVCGTADPSDRYAGNPLCANGGVCGAGGSCLTTCAGDMECQDGYYCSAAGTCAVVKALGVACNPAVDCKGGANCRECDAHPCKDGVCCESACNGTCEKCQGGTGACLPIADGTDPENECADGSGTCGEKVCNGARACRFVGEEKTCGGQACTDGTLTLATSCDGYGGCSAAATQSCHGFACSGNLCGTSCTAGTHTGCIANYTCNAAGTACEGGLAAGQQCTADGQCTSGYCAGKCCAGPCDHTDPTCGGTCDGTGACVYPTVSKTCSCGGVNSTCNGGGTCSCDQHDAGVPDSGPPDSGHADGPQQDAAGPDGAPADGAPADGAATDAVGPQQDAAGHDAGGKSGTTSFLGCSAAPAAGASALPFVLLALLAARRRRR